MSVKLTGVVVIRKPFVRTHGVHIIVSVKKGTMAMDLNVQVS